MNRNPKHRLGAQRDAAELKEHPFFKTIDWDALARKQVTPPFKPVVESDESVANFDPEFTTADVRDAGPQEILDLDEEDPSEDWVTLSQSQLAMSHMPNGPLGSDRPTNGTANVATNGGAPAAAAVGGARGIQMPQKKKKSRDAVGTPLTNSVQENFIGFTYHGESVMPDGVASLLAEQVKREAEQVVEDEAPGLRSLEEEDLDLDTPVGRYAEQRRGMHLDGFDEDLGL